jgi:hypothetical protein
VGSGALDRDMQADPVFRDGLDGCLESFPGTDPPSTETLVRLRPFVWRQRL